MAIRMKIRDKEFGRAFSRATHDGLARAGIYAHNQMRLAVNISNEHGENPSEPGEPPHKGTGWGQANIVFEDNIGNNKSGDGVHVRVKSPAKQGLLAAIRAAADYAVRIGIHKNGMYMFWLDQGMTKRQRAQLAGEEVSQREAHKLAIAPRPWLLATVLKFKKQIAAYAMTGARRSFK